MKFELKNKVIYILSPNHWGDMHISKHHYAKALAQKGNTVFFISPPSLKSSFFEKKEVEPHLFVINYSPIFRGKSVLPTFIFNVLIKLQIWFLTFKIGVKPDILWSFTTTLYFNLTWFKAPLTIFHPMDQLNTDDAKKIPNTSDIIFTCSAFILNEMNESKTPKHFISHGVSPYFTEHHFPEIISNKTIHVGYVGNLFMKNIDRKILKQVIESNQDCHFHFLGASEPNKSNISAWIRDESLEFIEFLKSSKNVTCYGAIPSNQIPQKIEHISIFLLCYEPDEENIISNSHKILEYLSTGKTIVSSYIHEYKNSDLMVMCEEKSNKNFLSYFVKVKTNLIVYNSIENQQQRKLIANRNSYTAKIKEIENYIDHLPKNTHSN